MVEKSKAIALTAVLVFFSSLLGLYGGAAGWLPGLNALVTPPPSAKQDKLAAAPDLSAVDQEQLARVQKAIEDKFISPVTPEKLTEGALKGMVQALGDPYSLYMTPTEYKAFLDHFKAEFSGIGVNVELSPKTGLITVISPIKGSPGDKAGVKPGDSIVQVDATDIRGFQLEEAVQLIRGPKGTNVTIKVMREGVSEPLTFTIVRDLIKVGDVEAKMVDAANGIGYLYLRTFNEQAGDRVSAAIRDLKAQGMTRLIFDLRQNPGGLLDEAIRVSSVIVPAKKTVVSVETRNNEKQNYPSTAKAAVFDMPLVVLVDENSASASEIVAGAIKDLKLGVLLGKKTFGKGTVQSFFDLPDASGIKLTTARYYTAGGNMIHGKGIEPDIDVANPNKVLPGDPGDPQLEKALEHIKTLKR